MQIEKILLDAGSGGRASQRLINDIFRKNFDNAILAGQDDAAVIGPFKGKLAVSTDGFTVEPIFFPGGSIGSLAVNGTVNDVSMMGAKPLYLSAAFIIEEGFPVASLERIARDMADACEKARVKIITGDTKVVPHGACDKIFITTTGIGEITVQSPPSGHNAKPGDAIILSGAAGDHGIAILLGRNELDILSDVSSDCAPLNGITEAIMESGAPVHVLRDPTRGGVATTLNEIAEQSGVCMELNEGAVPVHAAVEEGCSFLGLDPLYLANEGKLLCIVPKENARDVLERIKACEYGQEAAIVGEVTSRYPGKVILHTKLGGERFLGMLEGAPLPRIC